MFSEKKSTKKHQYEKLLEWCRRKKDHNNLRQIDIALLNVF